VGTERGGPIPIKNRGVTQSYKKDLSGETVITRMDERTLMEIARPPMGICKGNVTAEVTEKSVIFFTEP